MRWLRLWSACLFLLALSGGQALGLDTNHVSVPELIQRGRAELASNRWEAAADDFRSATESAPSNSLAYAWLGYSLLGLERYQEAVIACETAVGLDPERTNTWYYLGGGNYSLGNYKASADAYQTYVSLKPEGARGYYGLFRALFQLGRLREAEQACRRAVDINPTNSLYQAELGQCLDRLGRYGEAVQVLQKALVLKSGEAETWLWLGVSYYHLKTYDEAITALRRCIAIDTTNFYGVCYLGYSLYELGRYKDAAQAFQEAIGIRPDSFDAHEWSGFSLLKLGRFEEAATSFERAYKIRQESRGIRPALFCCYLLSSQYDKAYRLYPVASACGGGGLLLLYLMGLTVLLRVSFKPSTAGAPGLGFSLAWLAIFIDGQVALVLCLWLLSLIKISESFLFGIILADVPILIAATRAFARQPWGKPFAWPPYLGAAKTIGLALLWLVLALVVGSWCARWVAWVTHRSMTAQEIIPIIQYALRANPVTAVLCVVVVAPVAEEVLFRGLIYGALEGRVRIVGAILGSAFIFALVHLQVVHFAPILFLGVVLGWARWKTGSLGLPILLHILNNGFALLVLKYFEKGV
jgi:tetratricopeptide (TPR) repeat protein/membrane protease YdiL (CAAX protease family)